LHELIEKFSIDRVHKAGARFDYEKAKWFNHEWIKKLSVEELLPFVKKLLEEKNLPIADDQLLLSVISLVRDRCSLIPDFYPQAKFFFEAPQQWDLQAVKPKWNDEKADFFGDLLEQLKNLPDWTAFSVEAAFKELAVAKNIKAGELQLPLRIMLVGEKMGPPVFEIAATLGRDRTIDRIERLLDRIGKT